VRTYRALDAGLGLAGAQLPAAVREVLGGLAQLPFPRVSPWVFGVVAGSPTDGDDALDLLQDASLVEPVLREDRDVQFQLHDLVRLHARRTAAGAAGSPPVAARVEPVAARLLDLALDHAHAFPSRLLPPPPDAAGLRPSTRRADVAPEEALRFFATEQDTILACARHTAPTQPATAWRLLATMGNLVQGVLEPGLWLDVADVVRTELGDATADGRRGLACLDLVAALLRHEAADSAAAIPLATRARRSLMLEGDALGALTCAIVLGRAHRAAGRGTEAEEALSWADRSCTPQTPALTRGYIELAWGSLYDDYDRLRPARDKLRTALSHLDGTDDWAGRATAQFALARVHRRLGEYDRGLPLCEQAMDLFRRLGDANGATAVLDTRADLLVHMGDPGSALPPARDAVARASLHHDSFMLHRAQRTLGRALAGVGALPEAEEHLWSSARGFESLQRPLSLAATLRDIGRLLQLQGRVDEARDIFLRERGWLILAGVDDLAEIDGLIARLDARHLGAGGRDAG
jgi:tetratricopeptide (TPR) repeat protein